MSDDLVRSELLKLRTTSLAWFFSAGILASLAIALLTTVTTAGYAIDAALNPPELPPTENGPLPREFTEQFDLSLVLVRSAANIYTSGQFLGLLLVLLLGALIVTNEFHHSTATATFLTTPRRTPVIVAKLLVAVFVAAAVWLVTTGIDIVAGLIFFATVDQPNGLGESIVWQTIMLSLLAYIVWAVFGVGLGVLLRSQLGATVLALLLYLISLPLAYALFGMIRQYVIEEDWVWTAMVIVPGVASQVATSLEPPFQYAPQPWVGALVLVGYGLLAGIVGTAAIRRADIT
jgi:TM2 domain-containing membrane protein YozV